MTLHASFPLSMSQVAVELGLSLPLSVNHPWIVALAQKSGLPVSFSDLLGKTGRFDGNVAINATGFGPMSAPLFGATLVQLTGAFNGTILTQANINFATGTWPPNYTGKLLLTNNTTGISCVCTQTIPGGSPSWSNQSPPQNVIRANVTDNFTILPSN